MMPQMTMKTSEEDKQSSFVAKKQGLYDDDSFFKNKTQKKHYENLLVPMGSPPTSRNEDNN